MAVPPFKPRANTMMRPSVTSESAGAGARMLNPGSTVLGRYTIQKVIGRGGMATVYLARNQQTERLVALKILDPEISGDPSYVERFRREARAAGRIRSDNVVAIYDLDAEVGGTLVLVMEYLEGQTVQQALRNGRLPVARALVLARQLCEGLAAAHEAAVIHRDLKPANLFIEKLTGGGRKAQDPGLWDLEACRHVLPGAHPRGADPRDPRVHGPRANPRDGERQRPAH